MANSLARALSLCVNLRERYLITDATPSKTMPFCLINKTWPYLKC